MKTCEEMIDPGVSSRSNEMAHNILIGNAKAEAEVCLNLTNLSIEEKNLILKVLERDKLIQKEISDQLRLSQTKDLSNAKSEPSPRERTEGTF